MSNFKCHFCLFCLVGAFLVGCASHSVPKNPPLVPYDQRRWVEINQQDFVPPQAKMYAKVAEVYVEPAPQQTTGE